MDVESILIQFDTSTSHCVILPLTIKAHSFPYETLTVRTVCVCVCCARVSPFIYSILDQQHFQMTQKFICFGKIMQILYYKPLKALHI